MSRPLRPADLRRLALLVVVALLGAAMVAVPSAQAAQKHPADPQAALRAAEQQRQLHESQAASARAQAAATAAMAAALTQQRVQTAAKLRDAENATAAAADRLAALAARKKQVTAELVRRAAAFAPLLPLIERLALFPSETLLAVPTEPRQALRGLLVLQGLSHEIERQAAALKAQQAALDQVTADMQGAAPALAEAQAVQAKQAADLDAQIASAQASQQAATDAAATATQAAATDARRAADLQQVIAQIARARALAAAKAARQAKLAEQRRQAQAAAAAQQRETSLAAPDGPGLAAPSGAILAPVAGQLVRDWGDKTVAGPSTGLSFATPPTARVISPCGGRVVFGDQFRSYGLLVIVDCGGGYDFVLAGLDRLDVAVGQKIGSGEPVGVMAGWDPTKPAQRPHLYLELRKDGTAVNPAPWLRRKG